MHGTMRPGAEGDNNDDDSGEASEGQRSEWARRPRFLEGVGESVTNQEQKCGESTGSQCWAALQSRGRPGARPGAEEKDGKDLKGHCQHSWGQGQNK